MGTRIKWGITGLALLLLLSFSILAPRLADAWADQNTIGKLSYETVIYEPYQPTYYSTFEEKLMAMAACITEDSMSYAVQLSEGEDAPDDETLLDAANQELQALYQNGILPEKILLETLLDRAFMEVYVLPQGGESVALTDCYFWKLTASVGNGEITLCMDRSFYKIYWMSMETEYVDETTSSKLWIYRTEPDDVHELAQKWCRYWGLEDVVLTDTSVENEAEVYDKTFNSDSVSLCFPNQYDLTFLYEWVDYISLGKNGGQWMMSGLSEFHDYSTIQF